jgi:radical SAM superfamily enzyme YgiQ (UPF0313 family)
MVRNTSNFDEYFLREISKSAIPPDIRKPYFILIIPPSLQIPTPGREFFLKTPMEGVSYIATTLKNAGYRVKIVDHRIGPTDLEEILKYDKVVLGIATFLDSFVFLEDFIKRIREKNRHIPIVLGGSLVSSAPKLLMKNLPADYAVLGEGELTILELLDALSKGKIDLISRIPGICFRQDGEVFLNLPRSQIRDLDSLPELDLDLWPRIGDTNHLEKLGFSSSRGCYANCSFCFKTIPLISQMSPNRFAEVTKYLAEKYRLKFFYINDLTFVIDRKRAIKSCHALKTSGIHWACSTRVDNIDEDLLRVMKDSGCEEIWYGMESVDQKVLSANFKKITAEQIEKAVEMTNKAGIKVMANFIIGLLGETQDSLNKMIRFVETRNVIPCSIKYLTPFPGTYVYDYARRKGLIRDEVAYLRSLSRRKVNYAEDEIINCTDIPIEELRETFKRIRRISYDRYGPLDWNQG